MASSCTGSAGILIEGYFPSIAFQPVCLSGQGWLRSRHVAEVAQALLTDIFGQFIALCPVADFIGHCATSANSSPHAKWAFLSSTSNSACESIYNHNTRRLKVLRKCSDTIS